MMHPVVADVASETVEQDNLRLSISLEPISEYSIVCKTIN